MKVVVIIPTYNERENIGRLIEVLEAEFAALSGYQMVLLVVDDNSPDGTAEVVRQAMTRWANVRLLGGVKRGLGAAFVRAFRYALAKLEAEIVVTIDADFSHDPQDVKRLLAKLGEGYDYVIGSRYLPGGSIPTDWGWHRKFLSYFGNLMARVLGVWAVHDLTPAFRAMRVAGVLDRIDLESLPEGYAFQVALVCRARDVGARLGEVPIHFTNRERGQSKMPLSTLFEALEFLLKYRWGKILNSKP